MLNYKYLFLDHVNVPFNNRRRPSIKINVLAVNIYNKRIIKGLDPSASISQGI